MKQPQLSQDLKADSKYFDFMTLLFLIGYLLIDFMPYFQRTEIIKPQFLYLTVLNIIVALYIYYNPKLHPSPLLSILKKSYLFKAYLAFVLLCSLSIFTAKNISLGINAITEILVIFCMFMNFSILLYNRLYLIYKVIFIVGVCAFLQAFQALVDFKALLTNLSFLDILSHIKKIEGNTGNINIFSMSLLSKIPFIMIGISYFTNWKKWMLMLTLMLCTLFIFLINAKASLIALIIIVVVFAVFYFKKYSFKKAAILQLAAIILPIIIGMGIVNYVFSNAQNKSKRYSTTMERLGQINTNESSIEARLDFWKAAVDLTIDHPVLGVGLGNWRVESIPREKLKNGVVSLSTHNDFLQFFAETGLFNGLVYLLIFIALLLINLKRIIKSGENNHQIIAVLTLMLLIVYGIDALFNFPFYRPTMQLCFSFLVALTFVNTEKIEETKQIFKKSSIALVWVVIAIVPLYFTYHADQTSQLEFKIAADNINANNSGKLSGDDIVNQRLLIPDVLTSSESFAEYAGIYYLREKQYDKAIKYLDKGNSINPYLGRPDFYKHVVANERGMPDSAAYYAKASFDRYPVNPVFFNAAVRDKNYSDTLTVLDMYKRSAAFKNNAVTWNSAVEALKDRNYSKTNLHQFLKQGLITFPKDSTVRQTYTSTLITEHIVKGQALFAAGKYKEALDAYSKALEVDKSDVYALQNIGFYYFNLNQPKEAIPYLLGALKKPGLNGGKTEYFLAICYLKVNEKTNACKYLDLSNEKGYVGAEVALKQHCGL